MSDQKQVEAIEALLPQTQCGQCTYDGCYPYAKAIVEQDEAINRCPPGGAATMQAIAKQLGKPELPLETTDAIKSFGQLALINEDTCIGCTLCIKACPVDAIAGAAKVMHTVIKDECTGCELCIPPCPMDAIDMVAVKATQTPAKSRARYHARQQRLDDIKNEKRKTNHRAQRIQQAPDPKNIKLDIKAALARAKSKSSTFDRTLPHEQAKTN